MRPLLILGTGVFAEEIADLAEEAGREITGFVEGRDRQRCGERLRGLPIYWIDDISPLAAQCEAVCAVGSAARSRFIDQARALGVSFVTLAHPSAIVFPSAVIAAGAILGASVVVGAAARIGAHAILNRGCLVGHHVRVGDYATLGPGCNVGGLASVGSGCEIGMGAVVIDRVSVGDGATVGAASLVTRDVPVGARVVGSPARVVRAPGDETQRGAP